MEPCTDIRAVPADSDRLLAEREFEVRVPPTESIARTLDTCTRKT